MKSKPRTLLIALLAVLSLGIIPAASASAALPEFTGTINTTHPLEYEVSFGETRFIGASGSPEVYCEKGTTRGSFTTPNTGTATMTLTGCRVRGFNFVCNTKGAEVGELKTVSALPVALLYISKATKEVGFDFSYYAHKKFPPPPPPTDFEFKCGNNEIGPITGSVVAPITPINTKTSKFFLNFSGKEGKQTPSEYENEKGEKEFDGLGWHNFKHESESLSFDAGGNLTTAERLTTEIKA